MSQEYLTCTYEGLLAVCYLVSKSYHLWQESEVVESMEDKLTCIELATLLIKNNGLLILEPIVKLEEIGLPEEAALVPTFGMWHLIFLSVVYL